MTSADRRAPGAQRPVAHVASPGVTLEQALGQAVALLRGERIDEAEKAFEALLARWPDQPDALHFLGVLRHAQGRADEAVTLIRRALAAMPGAPGPWNNLGNVLLSAHRFEDATEAYMRSVEVAGPDPAAADAWNNLGTLHRKQGRLAEAEAACREAIARRHDFGDAWYNLSLALMAQGRVHDGLVANGHAIASWPRQLQSRDQVIRALVLLGERDKAAELYREWLAEEPDNPVVLHQLAACLGERPPDRASDAYVEKVFDSFAQSFDAKLEMLQYRAPQLVAQALAHAVGEASATRDIVDLGCGTGLCGPLVKPWARHLAGCDLSTGMLRRAKQRRVYDVLHKAELVHYLVTQPKAFDIIVCADTLCYFGDIGPALTAMGQSLRPGGIAIFTVEQIVDPASATFELQPSGRYRHAEAYVQAASAAAGLAAVNLLQATLRLEVGQEVNGLVVTLAKAA